MAFAVVWHWYSGDTENHSGYWLGLTIAAGTASAGLVALMALGARRDAGSGREPTAFVLAVILWAAGLLWYLAVVVMGFGQACDGTFAACSWECMNKAGTDRQWVSAAVVATATLALLVLPALSRRIRSRVVDRTAPALVLVLFVTAGLLGSPHGAITQCFAVLGRHSLSESWSNGYAFLSGA